MKKEEFLQKWDKETLSKAFIVIGEKCTLDFTVSCYEEDGVWKIFQRLERNQEWIVMEGEESEVFEKMDAITRSNADFAERYEKEQALLRKIKPKKPSKRKQMYGNSKK